MLKHPRWEQMPKKLRTLVRGYCQQEGRRMLAEDKMADMRGALERRDEELAIVIVQERIVKEEKIVVEEKIVFQEKIVYVEMADSRPEPKFRAGQGVHQWWAHWMPNAAQPPAGLKAKSRPAWFSSSVFVVEQLCPQA